MFTSEKLIQAGKYLHHYQYSKPIEYDYQSRKNYSKNLKNFKKVDPQANSNIYRTKKAIRLLLETNGRYNTRSDGSFEGPAFVTLTFADNVQDVPAANYIFTKFIQRLNYKCFKSKTSFIKYLTVIEFQKRGAIHYHVIFFNLSNIGQVYDQIKQCWTEGYSSIQEVKSLDHLTNYVYKDLVKAKQKDNQYNKKSYFTSKNLEKPQVMRLQSNITEKLKANKELIFNKQYKTGYTEVTYKKYLIK